MGKRKPTRLLPCAARAPQAGLVQLVLAFSCIRIRLETDNKVTTMLGIHVDDLIRRSQATDGCGGSKLRVGQPLRV